MARFLRPLERCMLKDSKKDFTFMCGERSASHQVQPLGDDERSADFHHTVYYGAAYNRASPAEEPEPADLDVGPRHVVDGRVSG